MSQTLRKAVNKEHKERIKLKMYFYATKVSVGFDPATECRR